MTVHELFDEIEQLRKAGALALDAVVQVAIYRADGTGDLYPATFLAGHKDRRVLTIYGEAGGDFPP
jgi:hypothetical protein